MMDVQVWTEFLKQNWLVIVIALVASALGTIFPQEIYIPIDAVSRDPAIYYEDQFGVFGKIYYFLCFQFYYNEMK